MSDSIVLADTASQNVSVQAKRYTVKEIFGPTVQGEGPMAGKMTVFLRFHLCDGDAHGNFCSWCDTRETWDKAHPLFNKHERMTAAEIVAKITELYSAKFPTTAMYELMPWVTISGGNPMIQLDRELVTALSEEGFLLQIETQGTKYDPLLVELLDYVVVSPKPPSSGLRPLTDDQLHLWEFARRSGVSVAFKFVVFDEKDFEYVVRCSEVLDQNVSIYLQAGTPVMDDAERAVAAGHPDFGDAAATDLAIDKVLSSYRHLVDMWLSSGKMPNAVILPQLHVLIWGRRKGV